MPLPSTWKSTSQKLTRRQFLKRLAGWGSAVGTIGLMGSYAYGIEPRWVETVSVPLKLPHLPPSFSKMKLAQFSDLHLGHHFTVAHLQEIVQRLNALGPDLLCFTGDLLDDASGLSLLPEAVPYLSKLEAPLGKWAVLGNHDYEANASSIKSTLEKSGFHVLINEGSPVISAADSLYIVGYDDALQGTIDNQQITNHVPPSACKILLVHEPDIIETVPFAVDLQLSGHSHGGQIALPGIGPLLTPPLGQKYPRGLYSIGESFLYTNRGIGTTILPLRFWSRPELTLFTLHPTGT